MVKEPPIDTSFFYPSWRTRPRHGPVTATPWLKHDEPHAKMKSFANSTEDPSPFGSTSARLTLGVMARAPTPGGCKTRLASALGPLGASRLYRAMLLDTLDALAPLSQVRKIVLAAPEYDGVSVVRALVSPTWRVLGQRGRDLGERLAHGISDLGASGNPVVLLSSDSPTLPVGALETALDNFAGPGRALLGPSEDGGYYLIGLTARAPSVFREISWSTPLVLEQTRDRMKELQLDCYELPVCFDVDTPADLDRFRAELAAYPDRAPRCAAFLAGPS